MQWLRVERYLSLGWKCDVSEEVVLERFISGLDGIFKDPHLTLNSQIIFSPAICFRIIAEPTTSGFITIWIQWKLSAPLAPLSCIRHILLSCHRSWRVAPSLKLYSLSSPPSKHLLPRFTTKAWHPVLLYCLVLHLPILELDINHAFHFLYSKIFSLIRLVISVPIASTFLLEQIIQQWDPKYSPCPQSGYFSSNSLQGKRVNY